jgi:PAS domain S-box-containing protein
MITLVFPPDRDERAVNESDQVSVTVVRAESAPTTEEEVFRAFADALPDTALMVFGKDLRYQVVAGAGITRFGWRRQDIVGRRPSDVLPPAESTLVEAEMRRVLAGEVRQFERGGVHDPGTVWSCTMTPLVTPEGSVVGGMIIAREVSEVRETERARRQAEQRCAVALAAAPVFVFTQDRQLRFTWANKTVINASPDLLVGRTDEEVLPPEAAAAVLPAKRSVLETGMGTRLVFKVPAEGGTRYFDMTLQAARDDTGAIVGITGAALDVTEIKKSEERFEAALEAVLDSVTIQQAVRSDAGDIVDFRISYATTEASDFAGRGPRDLVGRTILDLYPPLRGTGFIDGYVDVLRTGRPLHMTALPYGKGGDVRRYDLVASRLADDELLVVWRDVTDREIDREASARAEAIRAIAEELQRGLLPGDPPDVEGFAFAVAYQPANETAEVGGDWYDVVVVPGTGAVVVVVGDVEGHDAGAASLMGRISSVVRAEASRGERPSTVLEMAENFLLDLGVERMVTVAVASVCPATGAVTLASAGHPPPLLGVGSAVRAMEVDTGPPLGAGPAPRPESQSSLPPGGVMLFYTDGLLGPLLAVDEAMEELGACLARLAPGAPLAKLVSGVIRRTAEFQPSDDVAVVAMRRLDSGPR